MWTIAHTVWTMATPPSSLVRRVIAGQPHPRAAARRLDGAKATVTMPDLMKATARYARRKRQTGCGNRAGRWCVIGVMARLREESYAGWVCGAAEEGF